MADTDYEEIAKLVKDQTRDLKDVVELIFKSLTLKVLYCQVGLHYLILEYKHKFRKSIWKIKNRTRFRHSVLANKLTPSIF